MNLHGVVASAVSAVNPMLTVSLQHSTGYTSNADFTRTPTYATTTLQGQVQALTARELEQMSGLNLQGQKQAIYVNGQLEGVSRPDGAGGDLLTLPDGSVWLVGIVLEDWSRTANWSKAGIVRQKS